MSMEQKLREIEEFLMGIDAFVVRYVYEDVGLGHVVIEDEYGMVFASGETLQQALENL